VHGRRIVPLHALAATNRSRQTAKADQMTRQSIKELNRIRREFDEYWPLRNKATPSKCYGFLSWRIDDYRKRTLHYAPGE